MPNLDNLIRWQEYAPDIGENRKASRPFTLLIAVGITKQDLAKLDAASSAPLLPPRDDGPEYSVEELDAALSKRVEALAASLNPFVRMGPEPLFIGSESITSLQQLLMLYTRLAAGPTALLEVVAALVHFNSAGGTFELFSARLSGGSVSTTHAGRAAR